MKIQPLRFENKINYLIDFIFFKDHRYIAKMSANNPVRYDFSFIKKFSNYKVSSHINQTLTII
jgi:hypothetical protein